MSVFPEWLKAFKQEKTWVPEHAHDGPWGVVLEEEVEFVIGGETKVFRKGDHCPIPAGVPHSAKLAAGTAFDVWENQRFPADRLK